jgi:hypothetical protein
MQNGVLKFRQMNGVKFEMKKRYIFPFRVSDILALGIISSLWFSHQSFPFALSALRSWMFDVPAPAFIVSLRSFAAKSPWSVVPLSVVFCPISAFQFSVFSFLNIRVHRWPSAWWPSARTVK